MTKIATMNSFSILFIFCKHPFFRRLKRNVYPESVVATHIPHLMKAMTASYGARTPKTIPDTLQ
jgi:hypothetical protein